MTLALHLFLTALLVPCAWYDWRTRTAPNAITIPLFILGCVTASVKAAQGNLIPLILVASLLVSYWLAGGLGEADIKILVGLSGLWTQAAFMGWIAAEVFSFAWSLWRKSPTVLKGAPVLVAILGASLLTLIAELPIMPPSS